MEHYFKCEDGVAVLGLNGKTLFRVPDAVTELSETEKPLLDKNNLMGLPASINKLQNLTVLNLYNNKIIELPAEMGDLRGLRGLSVSYNQLVGLPTSIHRLTKLVLLYLCGNKLTELPAEIGDLRELWQLRVSQNPLTVDARRFALKLMIRGVHVDVAGEHSGHFSYLEVRKKTVIKLYYLPGKRKSVFFFSYRGFRKFEGLINH